MSVRAVLAKFSESVADKNVAVLLSGGIDSASILFSLLEAGKDGHFCLSKKGLLHYKNRIDVFRQMTFANPGYAQQPLHRAMASQHGKKAVLPYVSAEMRAVFVGKSWDDVNRPRQKQPILDAFPEQYRRMKILPHTNLQLGDSGIAEHFRQLLATNWNTGGWKSPVGIYNAVAAGRLS